jgi:ubiquinone/menaquinone biosynthesis C-methylase UbiE
MAGLGTGLVERACPERALSLSKGESNGLSTLRQGGYSLDAKLNKDEVREAYRKSSSMYDIWSGLTESKSRRRCLEVADIKNGESVLEVAVGTGILFEKILELNPTGRNEGIDLTEEMLTRARARAQKSGASGYVLKVGDAYHLQYSDNSFDVVLNNYMFDLIPEKDFLGGRIVLVNMTKGSRWFNAVWEWLYKIRPSLLGGCRGIEIKPYLEEVGFEKIRREYLSQMLFPSEVIYGVKP